MIPTERDKFLARYITVHDDKIPLPIKGLVINFEEGADCTEKIMHLCEMLQTIDEWIDDPDLVREKFYGDE